MPFDLGGGDLCDLTISQIEDGSLVVSDGGATIERAIETVPRFSTQSVQEQLRRLLQFYEIEQKDNELRCGVSQIDELGQTVFELCQVFSTIGDLGATPGRKLPIARDKGQLRKLAKSRFIDAGLWTYGAFHKGKAATGRINNVKIPVRLDYCIGLPQAPEVAFLCALAFDSQSVLFAASKFERLKNLKQTKKVSLIAGGDAHVANTDWNPRKASRVLSEFGPVINLQDDGATAMLREFLPGI